MYPNLSGKNWYDECKNNISHSSTEGIRLCRGKFYQGLIHLKGWNNVSEKYDGYNIFIEHHSPTYTAVTTEEMSF